jgi:vesicle-fusing ATPase
MSSQAGFWMIAWSNSMDRGKTANMLIRGTAWYVSGFEQHSQEFAASVRGHRLTVSKVFWGRPPQKVKNMVKIIQQKLKDAAPDIWLMPVDNLHITAMEVTHSKTAQEIDELVKTLEPAHKMIADYPSEHHARLIKPLVSYDSAALALSFVPAAGESPSRNRKAEDDSYTYHHLRRDLYDLISKAGVEVGSRYVVPSAHLTIARFNTPNPFGGDPLDGSQSLDIKKRKHWIREIEMINKWLEAEYWPESASDHGGAIMPGGEFIVGAEKGLDFRKGTLWYGGGETIYLGKGYHDK